MNPPFIVRTDRPVEPETYELPPGKRLDGNPRQTVWMHHVSPDGNFLVGLWRGEPGRWRVAYTEDEFCHVLEGRSVITGDGGPPVAVGPGDSFVVPRGFVGTWEVLETTTKRFVIREHVPAAAEPLS